MAIPLPTLFGIQLGPALWWWLRLRGVLNYYLLHAYTLGTLSLPPDHETIMRFARSGTSFGRGISFKRFDLIKSVSNSSKRFWRLAAGCSSVHEQD